MTSTENTTALPALEPAARANLYRFFAAALLGPPTQALLDAWSEQRAAVFAMLGQDAPDAAAFELNELTARFDELFRVPGGRYVTPFESVYADSYTDDRGRQRRRLMGPSAHHVLEFYQAAGAAIADTQVFGNMPDHLAAELDFMRFIGEQELAAEANGDAEQRAELATLGRRFLEEHLCAWIRPVTAAIEENDAGGFYGQLAGCLWRIVFSDAAQRGVSLPPCAGQTAGAPDTPLEN